jgi:hypothetical protein
VIRCRRDYERGKKKSEAIQTLVGSSGLSGGFQRSAPRHHPYGAHELANAPVGRPNLVGAGPNLTESEWCVHAGR